MMEPPKTNYDKAEGGFLTNNNAELKFLPEIPVVPFPDECPSL